MEKSILILDGTSLEDIKSYAQNLIAFKTLDGTLNFTHPTGSWMVIRTCDSCVNGYEDIELSTIRELIINPRFFVIDTNRFELLKNLFESFPININVLIDNNFGKILDRSQFLKYKGFEDFFRWDTEPESF